MFFGWALFYDYCYLDFIVFYLFDFAALVLDEKQKLLKVGRWSSASCVWVGGEVRKMTG
jgi:hypothetical protein